MPYKKKRKILFILVAIFLLWLVYEFKIDKNYPRIYTLESRPKYWGVTFSPKFAYDLGLDWWQAYLAILDDLQVKNVRLPVYWDWIEKSDNEFDFSSYDSMLATAEQRQAKIILNIGYRLPRWPECHQPIWAATLDRNKHQEEILAMLEVVVKRYQQNTAIVAWQVENEPLFNSFGECPPGNQEFLEKEIALVRGLDQRPIIISASGELSSWRREAKLGDIFGTTVYRVVWNPPLRYVRYPLPVWFYQAKAKIFGINPQQAMVSELQAEPWVPHGSLVNLSRQERNKSFSIEQFQANLRYADQIGFSQVYLWGVEWWYFLREKGEPNYWEVAKETFD